MAAVLMVAGFVSAGAGSAAGNSCSAVGLTKSVAVKAFGAGSNVSPQGTVCNVSTPSDTAEWVASVLAYPANEWSGLIQTALASTPKPKEYPAHGLGKEAELFTIIAPADNLKEQDVYLTTKSSVVHLQTASYPGNARTTPNPALATLARAVYAHLG